MKNTIVKMTVVGLIALLLCGCGNEEEMNNNTISPTQSVTADVNSDAATPSPSPLAEPTAIPDSSSFKQREEGILVKGEQVNVLSNGSGDFTDNEQRASDGEVVKLTADEEMYLIKGIADIGRQKISLSAGRGEGYTLSVNTCTVSENISATGNLYAAQLAGTEGNYAIQLLVEVEQTTEVYEYHVFSYFVDENYEYLQRIGILQGSLPQINSDSFTVQQVSDIIAPFRYEYSQEYVLCSAGKLVDEKLYYAIGKVSKECYPMNKIVKLKQDILLYDRDTLEVIAKAGKDSYLMLCATDADRWIYVEDTETTLAGWIRLESNESGKQIVSGADMLSVKDVFDNDTLQYGY